MVAPITGPNGTKAGTDKEGDAGEEARKGNPSKGCCSDKETSVETGVRQIIQLRPQFCFVGSSERVID